MRYVKIFSLHFQDVFNNRGRSFVWFLVSLLNPLFFLIFWNGVIQERGVIQKTWTMNAMTSYYLLLTIASSFLIVHIEEDVAWRDIKEGILAKYLVRPFSYLLIKFMEEMPWRIIQGFFGVVVFLLFTIFLNVSLPLVHDPLGIMFSILITILAFVISFLFKMSLGLTAFWTTDFWGTLSLEEIGMLIIGGIAMPLTLYPTLLQHIARILPLAYIVYFPVVAIEGILSLSELEGVVFVQLVWIVLLYWIYRFLWDRGIKKFTAIGQ